MREIIDIDLASVRDLLLPKLKTNLRITGDDLDTVLADKLLAALHSAGHYIGGVCVPSTVTATGVITSTSSLTSLTLRGPVLGLTSVVVAGEDVTEGCTLAGEVLTIPGDFDSAACTVIYRAGYSPIPPDMAAAVILIASSLYSNPLDTVEVLPKASSNLLRNYRWNNG